MSDFWDEDGLCRVCRGSGFFRQERSTVICPGCRGKLVANNSKAAKEFKQPEVKKVCPKCGGLGFIQGCCGDGQQQCPICTK